MRILHIAPFNTAGVPLTLARAERTLGHESRLITLARHPFNYPEDICLDLPFIGTPAVSAFKKTLRSGHTGREIPDSGKPPLNRMPSLPERLLFTLRDAVWGMLQNSRLQDIDIDSFDLYQLDGGLGLFRDFRTIRRLSEGGKPVSALYLGSDLRTRGVFEFVHRISVCNFTVEYDHVDLYPGIHHLPFPFDFTGFDLRADAAKSPVVIGHAPSVRVQKGTETILRILEKLRKKHNFEIMLIENRTHAEALELKRSCSLFIDQISDLGYGVNAIESMAMGIPTFSSLMPQFRDKYPDHPFIEIRAATLEKMLIPYIEDAGLRVKRGAESAEWVRKAHDAQAIVRSMHAILAKRLPDMDFSQETGNDT